MSNLALNPSVKLVNGQATTTSIKIAEAFGKRHCDVLRAIKNLECSPEFAERNFALSKYEVKGGKNSSRGADCYTITRDGFAFLASGFTGSVAAQWKEKYIAAFNALEKAALEKAAAKCLPKPVAAKALPAGRYHYPRAMLNQPYFVTPKTGEATLSLSMLANIEQFVSPLFSLLNQLRSEGHEITGAFDEAMALRRAVRQAHESLNELRQISIQACWREAE